MIQIKRKTAPDAATSKGGKSNNTNESIPGNIDRVKWELEHLHQQPGDICPRCGDRPIVTHVASLYADVYICQACIDDERYDHAMGLPHLLLEDWDYIRRMGHEFC